MPVIDHSTQPMGEVVGKVSSREMVSGEHGTEALSIRELVVEPDSRAGCTLMTATRR